MVLHKLAKLLHPLIKLFLPHMYCQYFNAETSVLVCENHSMINGLKLYTTSISLGHY